MLSELSLVGTDEGKLEMKAHNSLSEAEIDAIIIAQADDDAAWEPVIHVQRHQPASIALPADLAARAAFLARVHHQNSMEAWLRRIIEERIELEEAAFVGAKRALAQQAEV